MSAVITMSSGAKHRVSAKDGTRCEQAILGAGAGAQTFNLEDGRQLLLVIENIESVEVESASSASAIEAER